MDPRPTGMRSSWAAAASWRFALNPPSEPPVMQEMKNGRASRWPRKDVGGVELGLRHFRQGVVNETDAGEPGVSPFNREPRRIRADRQVLLFPRPCPRAPPPC